MKITHKLAALATAAVMAMSFISCDELLATFGKDDFCGTWVADYPITSGSFKGQNAAVIMVFNGKSESLLSEGVFFQSKIRYASSEELKDDEGKVTATIGKNEKMRNFYWGTYKLKDNSNYTAGRLVLTYKYGIQWNDGEEKVSIGNGTYSIKDLASIVTGDSTALQAAADLDDTVDSFADADAFFAKYITKTVSNATPTSSNPNVEVDFGKNEEDDPELYADIETFVFALGDAGSTSYCSLNANEWWMVDQIDWSKNSAGDWEYSKFNSSTYTTEDNGKTYTGTLGTRAISFVQPTGTVSKGTAKNHSEATGPWDKNYYSAGRCSWEVASRTFARITNKLDVDKAFSFLSGEEKDMKGKYIDYIENATSEDAVEYDDYEASDDGDYRSAYTADAVFADADLIEKVGSRYAVEK